MASNKLGTILLEFRADLATITEDIGKLEATQPRRPSHMESLATLPVCTSFCRHIVSHHRKLSVVVNDCNEYDDERF